VRVYRGGFAYRSRPRHETDHDLKQLPSFPGFCLVDGKLPGNYQALIAYLKKISDQPVLVLINTDPHEEHTSDNASFLEAGTQILEQENLRNKLKCQQLARRKSRIADQDLRPRLQFSPRWNRSPGDAYR
jgi:hypothetical protein